MISTFSGYLLNPKKSLNAPLTVPFSFSNFFNFFYSSSSFLSFSFISDNFSFVISFMLNMNFVIFAASAILGKRNPMKPLNTGTQKKF
jgi:hypothetical protein